MSWAFQPLVPAAAQLVGAGYINVYTGAGWELKPVKIWNGASWVQKPVKFWSGSDWVVAK